MAPSHNYSTPEFEYGDFVFDDVRGEVEIVGLSEATIPWPIGKKRHHRCDLRYVAMLSVVFDVLRLRMKISRTVRI